MQGDWKNRSDLRDLRERRAAEGGRAVVERRGSAHMAAIGRKGGLSTSKDRAHMSKIGRKGGSNKGRTPEQGA